MQYAQILKYIRRPMKCTSKLFFKYYHSYKDTQHDIEREYDVEGQCSLDYPRGSNGKPAECKNLVNKSCKESNENRNFTCKTNVCQDKMSGASIETNGCQTEISRNDNTRICRDKCDRLTYDKYSFYNCLVQAVSHIYKQPSNKEYFIPNDTKNDGEKCKNEQ